MTKTRDFHLGDVLTVTTGRLLSPRHMEGIYDLLQFMTGQPVFTHQLGRVSDECKPSLYRQHPWLRDFDASGDAEFVMPPVDSDGALPGVFALAELDMMIARLREKGEERDLPMLLLGWLAKLAPKYGEMISIEADPPGSHPEIDPVKEMAMMCGSDEEDIIVVETLGRDEDDQ